MDHTLRREVEAVIVPLDVIPAEDPWEYSHAVNHVDPQLKSILESGSIFITNPDQLSHQNNSPNYGRYFVLMHVPVDQPTMCRGGLLLRQTEGDLEPVHATIDGMDYAVEIKGCGSPVGGFPDDHFRLQAGSVSGFHIRVTGGQSLAGAEKEFLQLLRHNQTQERHGYSPELRILGVQGFSLMRGDFELELGQVLRLTPSNIRLSFYGNPAIDTLQSMDEILGAETMGRELALFTQHSHPCIHRNMSWNNLVYVGPHNYVITDFEELDDAYLGHSNLELIECIYPFYFNSERYRKPEFLRAFINGLCAIEGTHQDIITSVSLNSFDELNTLLLKQIYYLPMFRARVEHGMSAQLFDDLISYLHFFMPESYFKKESTPWTEDHFLPLMTIKQALLDLYIEWADTHSFETLHQCWDGHAPEGIQRQFEDAIEDIEPGIRTLIAAAKTYTDTEVGSYTSEYRFVTLFYEVPDTAEELQFRIHAVDQAINQAESFLESQLLPIPEEFITDTVLDRREIIFSSAAAYIYPFLPHLMVFFHNEYQLLKGVIGHETELTDEEFERARASLNWITEKQTLLQSQPEHFHAKLREGKQCFLDFIRPPYLNK
jgi:hypothetical protein